MKLRAINENETHILKDFLYEAIFIPEGVEPPAREIIEQPELKIYYEGFGNNRADNCIVADDNGRIVGAVWTRIMDDYGHVDGLQLAILLEALPGAYTQDGQVLCGSRGG